MPHYTTTTYHYPRSPITPSSSPLPSPNPAFSKPVIHQAPPSPALTTSTFSSSSPPSSPAMPHATTPSSPFGSPPRVQVQPTPSSYSRPARDDESYVMRAFAKHAGHCTHCADAYASFKRGGTLCSRGHKRAADVVSYVFARKGKVYSTVDRERRGRQLVEVEIPAKSEAVKSLLRAMEKGLRIEPSSGNAEASQERDHLRRTRSHQEPRRHRNVEVHYDTPIPEPQRHRRERRRARPEPIFTDDHLYPNAQAHALYNDSERYYAVPASASNRRRYYEYEPVYYVQGGYYP